MRVVLVGPPGAGKGTQAQILSARLSVPRISTGDIFRTNVEQGTPTGVLAQSYMDDGELVPDEVTIAMVRARLAEGDACEGYLLDGFPRTVPQADVFDAELAAADTPLQVVLELVVDHAEVIRRLSGRRTCARCAHVWHVEFDPPRQDGVCDLCDGSLFQRKDDDASTMAHRLEVYAAQTAPLIAHYAKQRLLVGIDATGPVDDVTIRAERALARRAGRG